MVAAAPVGGDGGLFFGHDENITCQQRGVPSRAAAAAAAAEKAEAEADYVRVGGRRSGDAPPPPLRLAVTIDRRVSCAPIHQYVIAFGSLLHSKSPSK